MLPNVVNTVENHSSSFCAREIFSYNKKMNKHEQLTESSKGGGLQYYVLLMTYTILNE